MSPAAKQQRQAFRPRARLMATLGHELISSDVVALSELVKNSYDADAQHVVIRISGNVLSDGSLDPATGAIQILDDGCGMSLETAASAWLEPATPFRRRDSKTPGGRRVLGEKGVGRFATAKLGDHLELISKASGSAEVRMHVDWTQFEDDERYLDEVQVELETGGDDEFGSQGTIRDLWASSVFSDTAIATGTDGQCGTLLTIRGLRSGWTSDLAQDARDALEKLVSPLDPDRDIERDFRIELSFPGVFDIGGEIERPDVLSRPHYRLVAEVNADGMATILMELKEGHEVERADFRVTRPGESYECGPYAFSLSVWDRDPASLKQITDDLPVARDALNRASGISIYRDGFRVLPYGEPDDDWLRLDARRVQVPTRRLSNNQLIGYILIGRDSNPELRDQSNREGLMGGPAFLSLRNSIIRLLELLEAERFKQRPRQPQRSRPSLLEPVDLTPVATLVAERIPDDAEAQTLVSEAQREIEERFRRVGETLAQYHRLATLGRLMDNLIHEAAQPIAAIRNDASTGKNLLSTPPFKKVRPENTVEEVVGSFDRIDEQGGRIRAVIKRVEPFGGRTRGRPRKIVVEEAVTNAIALLGEQVTKVGAQIEVSDTHNIVTLDATELQQVLVNLLSNSLYWLQEVPKAQRRINITVDRSSEGDLELTVEDSGPGVPDDDRDFIFDAYFSTKPDGNGLGLAITGTIIKDYYDGKLELKSPGELGGAKFLATFRKRVQ